MRSKALRAGAAGGENRRPSNLHTSGKLLLMPSAAAMTWNVVTVKLQY
jgi:hypothetical protein